MAAPTQIRKGLWRARPMIDGRKHTVSGRTKQDVEEQVAQMRDKQKRRKLGLPDPYERRAAITYHALTDRVLDAYPHRSQSKGALRWNLARSRKQFGRREIATITPAEIAEWLATLELADGTKRATLKAMRQAFARAVAWKLTDSNPAAAVEMPKEPDYQAQPLESWDEVRLVANQLRNRVHRAIVLVAASTGLRPQEWQALEWRDIAADHSALTVNRTVQAGVVVPAKAKTRGSLRSVQLSDTAREGLSLLPTPLRSEQLVLPGARGGLLDRRKWSENHWRKALAAAKLDYREPYALRDTYATLALAESPVEWVAAQMGNSPAILLKHYNRWLPETNERHIQAINAAQNRTQTGHLQVAR